MDGPDRTAGMPARGRRSAWQAGEMDIGFTEEQELLRDTARKFLDGNCTTRFVRDMMVDGGGRHAGILAPAGR